MTRPRSVWGWGHEGDSLSGQEIDGLAGLLAERFPVAELRREDPVPLAAVALPPTRLSLPRALAGICSTGLRDRVLHARGRSYADVVQGFRGMFDTAPDVVARPRDTAEVTAVLDWAADVGAAVVPFGGGTSVVGGVTPPVTGQPVVTLQMRAMDRVVEVDPVSLAARIEAGATGPAIEEQLRPHGLTLRFFPQSFELSTLGGWIATRAAGHYATRLTRIDDLTEQVAAVTPAGPWSSHRVPSSGAGPSPDRLLLGSEGALGVITEAWMRVQERPRHRARATVRFSTFRDGAEAVRALAQSGLDPANCRLLDPLEGLLNGVGSGDVAVLLVGFESARMPVDADAAAAVALCRDLGGDCPGGVEAQDEAGDRWRAAFLRAPHLRDALVRLGVISETFETATTWDRFPDLHASVTAVVERAVREVCGDGLVTCRITHAYPDGAAPYFTVVAPGRRGSEAAQWAEVKAAASDAVVAAGGTITHHHAVGRDHRRWYDVQRPEVFARALAAAKRELDPGWLLNPGVLLAAPQPGGSQ